jgi:hypothetical protein
MIGEGKPPLVCFPSFVALGKDKGFRPLRRATNARALDGGRFLKKRRKNFNLGSLKAFALRRKRTFGVVPWKRFNP